MVDDVRDIAEFYDRDPDTEDGRLNQHQLEYELTWRYLEQYMAANGSILELGAATGKYTLELARRGYHVTAVDLSSALIERCRERLVDAGLESRVRFHVADARELSDVGGEFDAILMMGPLYHLVEESDRGSALKEAIDRLSTGGVIFSSFLSRMGVLGDFIKRIPNWIEDHEQVTSFIERGRRADNSPQGGFRGYFAQTSEIAPLHEALGLETIVVAAVEPAISSDDESYNRLRGEQRRLWLDLLFKVSAEPSTVGASRHVLYIGRKKANAG